ncbi:MAG: prohibitin family protein [Candidatus Omnitrophica bacterium]|nr:prohibitin family protein [Candidatus Omnitrophota bacterium]MCM8830667.1 prohibitin family protein [Candidatus Omnitrophota bacterium]
MYTGLIWGIVLGIFGFTLLFTRLRHHDYNQTTNIFGIVFIVIAVILILFSFIRVVPAGTVGVVDIFGKVSDRERISGLNLVNPLAKLEIMNIKTEEIKEVMTVPSKEGLTIELEVSILYRLSPESASDVYKTVGPDYRNIIIIPQFRSVCRGVTVNYEAKALYTSSREEIAEKIYQDLKGMLLERGIILEKVLLRAIKLPQTVSTAIEMKLKAEQEAEQMKFILQKERQEAERKVIEAEGIAKAQEIINRTLTPAYLQLEAIKAQRMMANSPNHTTVYIPSGDNGIPLVRIVDEDRKK